MDIKYLNYILAIADRKNMTKAAEELYVSQSSLSQYLSRLEQELGTSLFNRTKGELSLTPAGELYVQTARKVVAMQKDLYQEIGNISSKGHISIGATSNFALRMLSEIIPSYKKEFPNVTIEISEVGLPALKKMMMEESIDIGIASAPNIAPFKGQAYVLREEPIFFAVSRSHPYAQKNTGGTIAIDELIANFQDDQFIMSKRGASIRILVNGLFDQQDFVPKIICETNTISTTRKMVAANVGVAFIGESCSINRDQIAYYRLKPDLKRLNVIFYQKNWGQNEYEQVFFHCLKEYFEKNTENPYIAD